MAIENESRNKEVLYVTMTKTRVTLSRERKLDWLSKPRPMALLHKQSFAQTRSRACLLNAGKGWGRTEATQFRLFSRPAIGSDFFPKF